MKTAEFARLYLFEPIGITDFLWEEDPQGYNDGWAGLYLHPRDLAKIGYLMLHQGQWEGKQIVTSEWVTEATQLQKKTGRGDDYGYGWWVPPPTQFVEFAAEGRGGQYIRVLPELSLVIVTTGGGFEWNEIVPMLVPAMVGSEALPINPVGMEQLDIALTAILQAPPPQAVPPIPELAFSISGRTYAFEFSPLDLKTICWEFDGSTEARLNATFYNQPDRELRVDLDGVYRMYPIGEVDDCPSTYHGLLRRLKDELDLPCGLVPHGRQHLGDTESNRYMGIVPADIDDTRHARLVRSIQNLVPWNCIQVCPPCDYRTIPLPL
jgi:hypothetical protein